MRLKTTHHRFFIPAVILLSVISQRTSFAQTDGQLLRVVIAETMTLEQLRPDRTTTHPQTSGDILLDTSMWLAQTNRASGVTVTLRTSTPFVNQTSTSELRDAELRIPGATGSGSWTVDTPIDQTNFATSDLDAEVQSSSSGPGQCWIPLEVTFITGDETTLVGGTYQLVVTGTISGN